MTITMRGLAVLASAVVLSGCSSRYESAGFHGAASMRVEVNVYKGPLTQSPEMQYGELSGLLAETVRALAALREAGEEQFRSRDACGIYGPENKVSQFKYNDVGCATMAQAIAAAKEAQANICRLLPADVVAYYNFGSDPLSVGAIFPNGDGIRLEDRTDVVGEPENLRVQPVPKSNSDYLPEKNGGIKKTRSYPRAYSKCQDHIADPLTKFLGDTQMDAPPDIKYIEGKMSELVRRVASVAMQMKIAGTRLSTGFIQSVPEDRAIRSYIIGTSLVLNEFSNLIQARTDLLDKQRVLKIKPHLMPVSDYLRDASPTDFMKLFDWLDGELQNPNPRTYNAYLDLRDRLRMVERLYADLYWEKINEVYTSGRGDTATAFVKDELGNWDLKSFSSDPSKLVQGYSSAASAALKAATEVVMGGPTANVNQAKSLMGLANQIATGQGSADVSSTHTTLALLRDNLKEQMARSKAAILAKLTIMQEQKSKVDADLLKVAQELVNLGGCAPDNEGNKAEGCTDAEGRKKALEQDQSKIISAMQSLPPEAAKDADRIIGDYLYLITAFQKSMVPVKTTNNTSGS